MDGIAVNPEELGGLPDRDVLLLGLSLLCALCAVLSHPGILDAQDDPCMALPG
jgi:hypothetical protein